MLLQKVKLPIFTRTSIYEEEKKMIKKQTILAFLFLSFLMAVSFFPLNSAAEETITLKASAAWPKTSPFTIQFFKLMDLVNERSNGRLQIKWIGGPEYVKAKDFSTAGASGTIDIFQTCLGYHSGKVPEGGIADAYPLFRSYETEPEAYATTRGLLTPLLEKRLKFKPICCSQVFPFYLWSKKKITSMNDFKGLKIRAHGGFVPFIVNAIGASPVTTPSTEVYIALERGIIDGAIRNLPALNSFKEYELTRYGISVPITWATGDICISTRAWNKLPKDLQNILVESGKEITQSTADFWKNKDKVLMKKFDDQKIEFYEPSKNMRESLLASIERGANEAAKKLSPKYSEEIINIYKKNK